MSNLAYQVGEILPPEEYSGRLDPSDKSAPWYPPFSPWRLYFRIYFTFGAYVVWWASRLAHEVPRHGVQRTTPWRIAAGLCLPGFGWIVAHRLAGWIDALAVSRGQEPSSRPGTRAWSTVLAVVYYQALIFAALPLLILEPIDPIVFGAGVLVGSLLAPLPILALQRQLNTIKTRLSNPRWDRAPGGIRFLFEKMLLAHYGYAAFFVLFMYGMSQLDPSPRANAEALAAGEPVYGASGLYSLTPPDGDWVRVGPDDIHEDSDLALYGVTDDVYVVVYVDCSATSIDERVRLRRNKMRDGTEDLQIVERRVLMAEENLPISSVRYSGRDVDTGVSDVSIVATVTQENFLVEVLGSITGNDQSTPVQATESLVKSLRLKEGVTSCGNS